MILSVSRRTDIPAFYAEWFMNRIRQGYVLVRNPMNYHQVSKIELSPKLIDCIVFWTKNPAPILNDLEEIGREYPFYFQYTLNAYDCDVEAGIGNVKERIEVFKTLSDNIGSQRLIWRYDPILISEKYNVEWHIRQFTYLSEAIRGYTKTCVISFIDLYEKVKKNLRDIHASECSSEEMDYLAEAFSKISEENGFALQTCAEKIDLEKYNIQHGCCIDGKLISEITGWNLSAKKDPNQREECGCLESIDIGQYNTCRHRCKYCYANFNPQSVITFSARHNPKSALLIGELEPEDKITTRKMKSLKKDLSNQISMF